MASLVFALGNGALTSFPQDAKIRVMNMHIKHRSSAIGLPGLCFLSIAPLVFSGFAYGGGTDDNQAPIEHSAEENSAEENSAEPIVRTLVMPLQAKRTVDPAVANTMTDVILTQFSSAKNREVLGQNDIAAALDLEAEKQMLGCDHSGCLEELAGAMDVDSLITGSIDRIGDQYIVFINELDARTVKPIAREQGTSALDEGDLFRVVNEVSTALIAQTSGKIQLFGSVVIQTIPSGMPVVIGARDVGLSPVETELPIGTHRVTIRSKNANENPASFDVTIQRKKTTSASVHLSVNQNVPIEQQEEYNLDSLTHNLLAGGKICAGLPLCSLGSIGTSACGLVSLQMLTSSGTPVDGQTQAEADSNHLTATIWQLVLTGGCGAVMVVGVGLLGWAIADLFSFPEEPVPGAPQHHIEVTAPTGVTTKTLLPSLSQEMAH